jgi:hypothetical protein
MKSVAPMTSKSLCIAERSRITYVALFVLLLFSQTSLGAEKIPGQKSIIVLGDSFQFIPGSWGSYRIMDKERNESYRMYFAILPREKKQKASASLMEVEVESRNNPNVITRFLADETPQGPGSLLNVVVQVQGYAPFTVPKKYFTGKNAQVAPIIPAQTVKRLEKKSRTISNRQVEVWEVEAEDAKGIRTRAVVSEQIAPIGLVEAENPQIQMTLEDWGSGAVTRITGKPRSFTLWILEQIADGIGKQP